MVCCSILKGAPLGLCCLPNAMQAGFYLKRHSVELNSKTAGIHLKEGRMGRVYCQCIWKLFVGSIAPGGEVQFEVGSSCCLLCFPREMCGFVWN